MKNRKRIMAFMLCVGLVFVLAASSGFIIHEENHDCIGEGCEICARIAATVHFMRSLALIGVILAALFAALLSVRNYRRSSDRFNGLTLTLVGWKVRLNN